MLREQPGNIIRVAANQDIKKTPIKKVRFAIVHETRRLAIGGNRESIVPCIVNKSSGKEEDVFDEETQDLINLQSALLNALALHYAHHGTASPVDVKGLISQTEQKWGKRRVTIEDIQLVLGIQHSETKSALSLAQRSKSRVCVEYDSTAVYPIPVETLKTQFRAAITRLQGSSFPKEEIKIYIDAEDVPLSKGAQRLQDIKSTSLKVQPPSQTNQTATAEQTTSAKRATSLLSRILQKETLAANSPAGPTPEMLSRRASLQRLEEIIPILCVLSDSSTSVSGRNLYTSTTSLASLSSLGSSLGLGPMPPAKVVSFTMSNVVQHLQNSMRHPIAREEAVQAIRLLADEIAPRWIGVRDVGSVIGVTFRGKIGRAEWSRRLQELLMQG